jgi:hypothetical protein
MATLAWWLIPIGATVIAIAFVAFRSRPTRPVEAHEAMERLRAVQDAMARPMPANEHDDQRQQGTTW